MFTNKKFNKPFRYKKFKNIKIYPKIIKGFFCLQLLEDLYFKKQYLISIIKAIKNVLRKKNILLLRIFFDYIYTQKPIDVRMGRGKGNMAYKIYICKKGTILLELKTTKIYKVYKALKKASLKLPVKSHILKKNYNI
jgi:large subunit ribosomal protein L16